MVIVAGEASGDMHGARLVEALRQVLPEVKVSGVGGAEMAAAGVEILYKAEDLTLMGFSDVPSRLGHILAALRGLRRFLKKKPPRSFDPH